MQEALTALKEKKFSEAIQGFETVIQANPNNFQAFFYLGQCQLQTQQMESAKVNIQQSIKLNPKFVQAYVPLAMAHQALKEYEDALQCYELGWSTLQPPQLPGVWANRGTAYGNLANKYEAEGDQEKANKYKEDAMNAFTESLKLNENNVDALVFQGQFLNEQKNYQEAIQKLQKAKSLNSSNPTIFSQLGHAYFSLNQVKEAIEALNQSIQLKPANPGVLLNLGACYDQQHQYADAIKFYDQVLSLENQNLRALSNKGAAQWKLKQLDDALKTYQQGLVIAENDPELNFGLGLVLYDQKKYEPASKSFQKAIESKCSSLASAHSNLANCYKHLNQNQEALNEYKIAIQLNPQNLEALNNQGAVFSQLHQYEDAIKSYDQALAFEKGSPDIHNNKGNALKNLKRYEEALREFDEVIRLSPKYVLGYTNRAQVYLELKDKTKAIEDLHQVDQLCHDPENLKDLSESNQQFIQGAVKRVIQLEKEFNEQSEMVKAQMQGLSNEQQDSIKKKMEELQRKKDEENQRKLNAISSRQAPVQVPPLDIMAEFAAIKAEMQQQKEAAVKIEEKQEVQEQEIVKVQEVVEETKEVMKDGGVYDKQEIRNGFERLKNLYPDNTDQYDYAKAFYWTILSRFDAYRIASTGALQKDTEMAVDGNEGTYMNVAKGVMGVASAIPIVGSFFKLFDKVMDGIWGAVKDARYESRMKSIVSIVMNNSDPKAQLKEEQSMMFARAAIEIANRKDEYFKEKRQLANQVVVGEQSKMSQAVEWLKKKVRQLEEAALGDKIDIYNSTGGRDALQDVLLVLAYMFKNSQQMCASPKPLDEQIADLVIKKTVIGVLSDADTSDENQPKPQQEPTPQPKGSGCCIIM